MIQESRADPLVLTWEPPVAIFGGWVLAAFLAVPGSMAVTGWAGSGRWVWPRTARALSDAATGSFSWATYVVLIVLELLTTGVAIWVTRLWWHASGPGHQVGVASKREVAAVLGRSAARRRIATIRPDLRE